MFHHILVPLDGTAHAEQAIPMAACIARASGGELTLLRILYNFSEYFVFTQLNGLNPYQFQERNEQIASEYLSRIRAHPALKDLPVQTTTLFGSPAKILVQHPLLEQSDLIVMCCHANAGWRRVFSGSVVRQVLLKSPIPVFILNEQPLSQTVEDEQHYPFRIFVALDGSSLAESAIRPAATLSSLLSYPQPGNIHFIRIVLPAHHEDNKTLTEADGEAIETAKAYLETIQQRTLLSTAPDLPLHIDTSIRCDDTIAEMLITAANFEELFTSQPVHAFAMATHGRRGFPLWLHGSVTGHMLGRLRLPLLVLKPGKKQVEEPVLVESVSKQNAKDQCGKGS